MAHVESDKLLVGFLARVDALFLPLRFGEVGRSAWHAIHQLRTLYHSRGLSWYPTAGSGAVEHKRDERRRKALADRGYVKLLGGKGRITGAQLTPLGDWRGRLLCDLPTLGDCIPLLSRLTELSETRTLGCWGKWVRETWLFDREYEEHDSSKKWFDATEHMLPALVRGLAESESDMDNHVCYMLTDRSLDPDDASTTVDIEPRDDAAELYDHSFMEAWGQYKHAKPPNENEIAIPLPVGV